MVVSMTQRLTCECLDAIQCKYTVINNRPLTVRMSEAQYTLFVLQWIQDAPYKRYKVLEAQ